MAGCLADCLAIESGGGGEVRTRLGNLDSRSSCDRFGTLGKADIVGNSGPETGR